MTSPTDPTNPTEQTTQTTPEPAVDESGFPANTPVAEMTDKQAAAYWKSKSRQWENRTKAMSDYEQLKANNAQYEALVQASKTDAEKAIDAAKAEARSQTLREVGSRLVDAEFTALTAGRMTDEVRAAHMIGLNREAFLTAEGNVNKEALTTYVNGIAPKTDEAQQTTPVDLGQGRRGTKTGGSLENGAAIFDRMFGKK